MKTNHKTKIRNLQFYACQPAVPNGAPPRYFTDKALNVLTTVVSAMGFVTSVIFLVIMA